MSVDFSGGSRPEKTFSYHLGFITFLASAAERRAEYESSKKRKNFDDAFVAIEKLFFSCRKNENYLERRDSTTLLPDKTLNF